MHHHHHMFWVWKALHLYYLTTLYAKHHYEAGNGLLEASKLIERWNSNWKNCSLLGLYLQFPCTYRMSCSAGVRKPEDTTLSQNTKVVAATYGGLILLPALYYTKLPPITILSLWSPPSNKPGGTAGTGVYYAGLLKTCVSCLSLPWTPWIPERPLSFSCT